MKIIQLIIIELLYTTESLSTIDSEKPQQPKLH